MTVTRFVVAVSVVMSSLLGPAPCAVAADPPLVTTVTAAPYRSLIPPPAPEESRGGSGISAAGEFFDFGLKVWANRQVKLAFQKALDSGLAEARKSGQTGVLLNVRYAENLNRVGQWLHGGPVGGGVSVVGIGPDPGSVCYINRCDKPGTHPLNATEARRYTNDSDYYWIGKSPKAKGSYVPARYNRDALEGWTKQVALSDSAAESLARAANIQIVDGLAQKLQDEAKTAAERSEIKKILDSREEARKELARIDTDLANELKRQDERAKTMETLKVVGWAIAAVDIVNTERVSQKGATASTPSLEQQMKEGALRIDVLRDRGAQWTNKFEGTTTYLLERAIQLTVPMPKLAPMPVQPMK